MKFCLTLSVAQLLTFLGSTSAMFENSRPINGRGPALKKLLGKARRLDEAGDDQEEVDEADMESFLMDYSLKFMNCIPDRVLTDEDYNDHYGVVIFRLCPSNKCSNNDGCSSGYADFAVDVGTYVEAFLGDQQDNMNWDDNFDGDGFGQCSEYEIENDDGDDTQYYIGPGCTEDGAGVKMGVYEDQYCGRESETSFETISNGWSLPYSDGGLVSTQCTDCTDEDGELTEMCLDLYDGSPHRCEKEFDFQHYYYDANFEIYRYGKDETGCTNIDVLQNPRSKFSQEAVWQDAVIVVLLVVVTAGGFGWYSIWWRKQKENLEKIDDDADADADSQYHLDGDNDDLSGGDGDGEDVNDSALNESGINNYEGTMT